MSSPAVTTIRINKQIPFFGQGDTLEGRLKKVGLRGFPGVKVYKNASLSLKKLTSAEIPGALYTPQPHLHLLYLQRIHNLAKLFKEKGIDIYHLGQAYDYTACAETGEITEWTMLPPVVECFSIPRHVHGGFDYAPLVGGELSASLRENGWAIDPQTYSAPYHNTTDVFNLINDGSHRVHAGLQSGAGITVLQVTGMAPGFPYYAVPQNYSLVTVFPNEDESEDLKIHVVTSPGHKQLYRLFPSGGILSGTVRQPRQGEVIV